MSNGGVVGALRKPAMYLMVGSAITFVAILSFGGLVFDRYHAYGEVPIPGTAKLHLPAGQATVSFHTVTVGSPSGGSGLPVPQLDLDIDPPAGVASPKVVENLGSSTSVNNDVHRRVWVVHILTEGDYIVTTTGQINGFIDPRMAFGYDGDLDNAWLYSTAGLFVIGLAGTVATSVWRSRRTRAVTPTPPVVIPSNQGAKIEQLKTLAALRDSGALSDKEFELEKRTVLDGD